jgi:2-alkenal reductase
VAVAPGRLSPLGFADSSRVKVGDPVVAIGSPFGFPQSVAIGIVSALGRTIQAPSGGGIRNAIQTDAAIDTGNSGGPLIDATGKVIGVNAQIASRSGGSDGVGFAVSSNTAKASLSVILGRGV